MYEGRHLLTVFATPERAMAQVRRLVEQRAGEKPTVVPLPFASISRTTNQPDLSRFCEHTHIRTFWKEATQRFQKVRRPQPVKLIFQVNLWTRLLRDIEYVQGQLFRDLRATEKYLTPVTVPYPFDRLGCRVVYKGMTDASRLEGGGDQRILRRIFNFECDAWICYNVVETPIVERIDVEICRSEDMETEEELLDTVSVMGVL